MAPEKCPIKKKIKANKAIVIATYGKISYGHVLYDAQKILNAKIVSAAYIPAKHTYIKNDINFNEYEKLDEIINNINDSNEIKIKKTFKNPLANFFPITRHKLSVRIIKTDNCIDCGKCNKVCKSINNGIIIDKCTKCLRCIYSCNNNALKFKLNPIMKKYLKKKKKNDFIIY